MTAKPLTVVMPVRNCEEFLDEAIRSIVEQTFADFDFLIYDDASEDGSLAVMKEWARRDPRVTVHAGSSPLGLARSSNAVTELADSPLIARMDGDDIAHPDRLKRQIEVMADESVAVCGTLALGIDSSGSVVRPRDAARALRVGRYAPFPHGSAVFRRADYDALGGYRPACDGWEDVDFFLRLKERGKALVILDPLYSYRYHSTNTSIVLDSRARLNAMAHEALCARLYEQTGNYEHALLPSIDPAFANGFKVHSYAMRGALSVWAGEPPTGRFPMPKPSTPGWLRASARALVYRTWGVWSPRSLRRVQAALIGGRDRRSIRKLGGVKEAEWHIAS
jgi:glycosyltransferase involved in cell wall biosynthesis